MLPTSAAFKTQVKHYIADTRAVVEACIATVEKNDPVVDVYKTSLAAHTVLGYLSSPNLAPSLSPARTIAVRVPLLVVIGQSSAALTELRRFVELIYWTIYFTDHPVEFQEFRSSSAGFTRDSARPISFAAHRELIYYIAYAKELMSAEPSGIALKAISSTEAVTRTLNSFVHAGRVARSTTKVPPYDSVEDKDLKDFARLQRATFASCCTVLAAYRRVKFNKMPAVARSYFDMLVGSATRKQIRSGPFGLS
jgi:hypothetical protein